MKIFITGATGGIGSFLVPSLADSGYELILLSIAPDITFSKYKNVQVLVGNILDSASYQTALIDVDIIIHLAAVTHTNDTALYYKINTEGTRILLAAAETANVKRFIFVSTRAIGKAGGGYSDSKAQAEELVKASGLAWTIVRPAEVYGVNEQEALTKLITGIEKMPFVPVLGNGRYKLAPVRINDVVQALCASLSRENTVGKTYTLAGPEEFTYLGLVDKVLNIKKLRKMKLHIPLFVISLLAHLIALLPFKHPPFVKDQVSRLLLDKSADISQARQELNYTPRSLLEGLA
jgi:nucleoside-diphosphate-sugar epimerase